jgi:hypothetical protein
VFELGKDTNSFSNCLANQTYLKDSKQIHEDAYNSQATYKEEKTQCE